MRAHWTRAAELFAPDSRTIVYERLVEDVGAEVRPLFDWLGLELDEGVLDHTSTARARGLITTASYSQVTEPIYKRAAEIVRNHTLKEFKPADFFAELVAADPTNIQPIKNYVEELRLAKQNKAALDVLAANQPKFPGDLGFFLKTRASILESTSGRRAAEELYSASFDATWPRAVAGDYFELLRKYGRYRIVRRGLQERVKGGATDLDTVARLFSVFVYEGNYAQAGQLLRDLESRRNTPQAAGLQVLEQASKSTALPSSHCSTPACTYPSPQRAIRQPITQPSVLLVLPSSHSSTPART